MGETPIEWLWIDSRDAESGSKSAESPIMPDVRREQERQAKWKRGRARTRWRWHWRTKVECASVFFSSSFLV